MALPTNAQERKDTPIFAGVLKYFPLALAEVAKCSKAGNDQHNPGLPIQWTRSKSGDELDALTRHLLEAGTIDTDGIRHSAKVAWRALANLEKELERAEEEAEKTKDTETFGRSSWETDMVMSQEKLGKLIAKHKAKRSDSLSHISDAIMYASKYGAGALFSSYPPYYYKVPDIFES